MYTKYCYNIELAGTRKQNRIDQYVCANCFYSFAGQIQPCYFSRATTKRHVLFLKTFFKISHMYCHILHVGKLEISRTLSLFPFYPTNFEIFSTFK